MVFTKEQINFFRENYNELNLQLAANHSAPEFNLYINNRIVKNKKLPLDFGGFVRFLFTDDYGKWKEKTDAVKGEYFSPQSFMENAELPSFSTCFYVLTMTLGRIPKPEEFFTGYLQLYCEGVDKQHFRFTEQFKPVRGERGKQLPQEEPLCYNSLAVRITRIYPSFLRELGVFFMLSEFSNFIVNYELKKDLFGDTDLYIISDNGMAYSLSLYNGSYQGLYKRQEKENNNPVCKDNKISLIANYSESRNTEPYGSVLLYDMSTIKQVIDIISKDKTGDFIIGSKEKEPATQAPCTNISCQG